MLYAHEARLIRHPFSDESTRILFVLSSPNFILPPRVPLFERKREREKKRIKKSSDNFSDSQVTTVWLESIAFRFFFFFFDGYVTCNFVDAYSRALIFNIGSEIEFQIRSIDTTVGIRNCAIREFRESLQSVVYRRPAHRLIINSLACSLARS